MTPRTRSGGAAPPPSIAYKSTPTLRQVQFPARRTKVRTYGRRRRSRNYGGDGEGGEDDDSAHTMPSLKQRTLTQYDFASSFNEDDVVELSDLSDVENLDKIEDTDEAEKENIGPSSSKRSKASTTKRVPRRRIVDDEQEDEQRVLDTEVEEEDEQNGDEQPVARKRRRVGFANSEKTKRRRTLGEEHRMSTMKESKSSRRRTLGDSPIAGSSKGKYHTQTLTQFIGRTPSFVADSDEEELGDAESNGFLEWLGDEEPPQSPSMDTQASRRATAAVAAAAAASASEVAGDDSPSPHRGIRRKSATQTGEQSREESVVPQTPIKSIRFDLPPSAQHASPSPSRMASIYGAPNHYLSPSKRQGQKSPLNPVTELTGKPTKQMSSAKKPELVIEDSYATEGFSSVGGTQMRHATPSQTQTDVFSTPAEEMATNPTAATTSTQYNLPTEEAVMMPPQVQTQDGQAEEQQFYGALSQIAQESPAASQKTLPATPKPATRASTVAEPTVAADEREIPDSDEDDSDFGTDSDASDEEAEESRFAAGAETQLLMDQLQSSVRKWSSTPRAVHAPSSSVASPRPLRTSSPVASLSSVITPQSAPPSSVKLPATETASKQPLQKKQQPGTVANDIPVVHDGVILRKPLHHPEPMDTQGMPLESQRVALATLQSFTPASARTDILLPISSDTLGNLLTGHQDAVVLPFKIPAQVVRFWLIHTDVLRYLACVSSATDGSNSNYDPKQDNNCGGHGTWTYHIDQVYELNNLVQEEDMRAEDWIHGQVARYTYFPPAVVSQLLWNLRQAIFAEHHDVDEEEQEEKAVTTPAAPAHAAATVAFLSSSPLQRSTPSARPRHGAQPGSPLYTRPPPSTMPAPPPPSRPSRTSKNHTQPLVRPSQATTASQASTVDMPAAATAAAAAVATRGDESSESLVFDDHGGSSIPMPYSGGVLGLDHLDSSQLLTKSQILPDSLMRDEEEEDPQQGVREEIWDSEEE